VSTPKVTSSIQKKTNRTTKKKWQVDHVVEAEVKAETEVEHVLVRDILVHVLVRDLEADHIRVNLILTADPIHARPTNQKQNRNLDRDHDLNQRNPKGKHTRPNQKVVRDQKADQEARVVVRRLEDGRMMLRKEDGNVMQC
jgi:hypothetical protein